MWRSAKQPVQECTRFDDLDAKFVGVIDSQMLDVVGNNHHFVQCWVIFFIESVDHDQRSGDQVPVILMHTGGCTGHENVSAVPGYQVAVHHWPITDLP